MEYRSLEPKQYGLVRAPSNRTVKPAMTVIRDELLAELDRLTQEQIEEGLAAGVWGEPTRPLVQHYLDQMKLDLAEEQVAEQRT